MNDLNFASQLLLMFLPVIIIIAVGVAAHIMCEPPPSQFPYLLEQYEKANSETGTRWPTPNALGEGRSYEKQEARASTQSETQAKVSLMHQPWCMQPIGGECLCKEET